MTRKSLLLFGISLVAATGLGYAAGQTDKGTMAALDEVAWVEAAPGSPISVATLWGNRQEGAHAALIKLPAGFVVPEHAHTGHYNGVNLTGTWRHSFEDGEERDLPPGSHVFQPGGAMHGDACIGDQECIVFVVQDVKADFIPKEK